MARTIPVLVILFVLAPHAVGAQSRALRGSLVDSTTHAPVAGAAVKLTSRTDTTDVRRTTSAADGTFGFAQLPSGDWKLRVVMMGYAVLKRTVTIADADLDLGALPMEPQGLPMPGVEVKATPPPAVQHGDTTEFASGAVRTHPDATGEELVAKMPGVTVDKNGNVKSNGETIQQVLVDGKPYFGNDPSVALRNLPAEVIDKIQIFNKLSDQAEFTGFDDGQTTKTMNVILRKDHAITFGKVYAGGGAPDRYQGGGHVNVISGPARIAAIGLANNVNQQNFSSQDLLDALNPGGSSKGKSGDQKKSTDAGSFLVGPQDGISTTRSAGGNLDVPLPGRIEVNQSYFFNSGDNHNRQIIDRRYAVPQDSANDYTQRLVYGSRDINQRMDGRYTWMADSSVIDVPRAYWQNHDSNTGFAAENDLAPGEPLSLATNQIASETSGHELGNHLLLRHRFGVVGRTLSLDIGTNHTLKDADKAMRSVTDDGTPGGVIDTLDRHSDFRTTSGSLNARLAYTEPVGKKSLLQFTLFPGMIESESARHGWQPDSSGEFTVPDGPMTNTFRSVTGSQVAGISFLTKKKGRRLTVNLAFQRSTLRSERITPDPWVLTRTFYDVLPSVVYNNNLSKNRNLRATWTTTTRVPNITQLQDDVDYTNPLALTIGNPWLRPQLVQNFLMRYSSTAPERSRSMFLGFQFQRTSHMIGQSTETAATDTVIRGVALARGTQLLSPANLNEAWSANALGSFSWPSAWLKSLVNLNTGATWTRMPGILNQVLTRTDLLGISQGIVLASNISPAVDFTISYTGTYNIPQSSVTTLHKANYYTQSASVRLNTIAWGSLVMRQEIDHTLQNGVASGNGLDALLWNSSVGRKWMQNRLDLRITASDVLARNRSTSRTVTESYIQDVRNQTLPHYLMLTTTYTWGQ